MKKILFGTTGLVAAAVLASTPALAADPISMGISGFMNQYVGVVGDDMGAPITTDEVSDSEIYVSGSTTLDNGLTVMSRMEIEADGDGAGMADKAWLAISSDGMGTVQLGVVDTYTDGIHKGAPDVGYGLGDVDDMVKPAGAGNGATNQGNSWDPSAGHKIQYSSPNFSGFNVGGFYVFDGASTGAKGWFPVDATTSMNAWGVGATYNGDYDGVTVHVDAGYGQTDGNGALAVAANDTDGYQLGAQVGFGGFTIGAGYGNFKVNGGTVAETTSYEVGASYGAGPWAASLSWRHVDAELTGALDDGSDAIMGSASYDLGGGVKAIGSIMHGDYDDGAGAVENSGWAAVTGLKVSF